MNRFESLQRVLGYVLVGVGAAWLWTSWQQQHIEKAKPVQQRRAARPVTALQSHVGVPSGRLVTLANDVLEVAIDRLGGGVVRADLLAYKKQLHGQEPMRLLSDQSQHFYVAQAGISGDQNCLFSPGQLRTRATDHAPAVVALMCQRAGVTFEKRYTLTKGRYVVEVQGQATNRSGHPWSARSYVQLRQRKPKQAHKGFMQMNTYTGPAYYTPDQHYVKLNYDAMEKRDLDVVGVNQAWVAMQQRYFLSAWVPEQGRAQDLFSRFDAPHALYTLGAYSSEKTLNPQDTLRVHQKLYVGPEIQKHLVKVAPGLELTIDYGWLWLISAWLFRAMTWIHRWVGNWGWSIVLLTAGIKLAFYRFSASSYRSMARMRTLKPKIDALQQRFSQDKEKLAQETMALYRREKINPMGGCLPILVQVPFFIALYWVLMESVQLRHAPFMGWIHDLSAKDPYYILPVVMGLSMLLQQRMTPTTDPKQAQIMMVLPVVFTFMFSQFPAGLVLYWVTNNALSILQQWWVTRHVQG